jgi:putative chitinase
MDKFGINTEFSLAHFLSQAGHESGRFRVTEENLKYSAKQLVKLWPKKFSAAETKGKVLASDYAYHPELIANYIYAKKTLGNVPGTSDGWNFRGRGFIQLTGKANYKAFEHFYNNTYPVAIDLMAYPDQLADDFNLAMISALWYFKTRVMDKTNIQSATVEKVTQLVNGGQNGINDRKILFTKALNNLKSIYVPFIDVDVNNYEFVGQ